MTGTRDNPYEFEGYQSLNDAIAALPASTPDMMNKIVFGRTIQLNQTLAGELAKKGLRAFKPLAVGSTSLVLQFPGEVYLSGDQLQAGMQVIRFNKGGDLAPRTHALEEVQSIPEHTHVLLSARGEEFYDILPMVPEHLNKEQWKPWILHLREKYGMPLDNITDDMLREANAKQFPNGPVMGVDQDFITLPEPNARASYNDRKYDPVRDADWVWTGKKDAKGQPMESRLFKDILPQGTISVQEEYFPSLIDGRIRGVLSDDDRLRLEADPVAAFKQLRKEKPECFLYPIASKLNNKEKKVFNEGGLLKLYEIRPDMFMKVEESDLPKFMDLVFRQNFYPVQAMWDIFAEKAKGTQKELDVKEAVEGGGAQPLNAVFAPIGARSSLVMYSPDIPRH